MLYVSIFTYFMPYLTYKTTIMTLKKYKIEHYFNKLPRSVDVVALLKEIDVNLRTFQRDKALLISDDSDIPSERLLKYSKLFGVRLEDLFNKKSRNKSVPVVRTGLKIILIATLAYTLSACANYSGLGKCPSYKSTPIHAR